MGQWKRIEGPEIDLYYLLGQFYRKRKSQIKRKWIVSSNGAAATAHS